MLDQLDTRIRALILEIVDAAPPAPPLDEIEHEITTSPGVSHDRRRREQRASSGSWPWSTRRAIALIAAFAITLGAAVSIWLVSKSNHGAVSVKTPTPSGIHPVAPPPSSVVGTE